MVESKYDELIAQRTINSSKNFAFELCEDDQRLVFSPHGDLLDHLSTNLVQFHLQHLTDLFHRQPRTEHVSSKSTLIRSYCA